MNFAEAFANELYNSKVKLIENKKVESRRVVQDTEEYLEPHYDSRASFYKKAKVVKKDNGDEELYSYGTHVGGVRDGKPYSKGKFSQTTSRHQREFFKQRDIDPKSVTIEEGKLEERAHDSKSLLNVIENNIIPELEYVSEFGDEAKLSQLATLCKNIKASLVEELNNAKSQLEEGCAKK